MTKTIFVWAAWLIATNAMAATGTSTGVVMPTSATAVSTTAAAVQATPKNLTVTFVAENSVDAAPANRGDTDGAASTQHIGLAYKLNENQSVQYRQYFYYNATNAARNDEYSLGEHMFRFNDAKALTVGDATVSADIRAFLPGSEYVRQVGQYQLRMDNAIEQAFGKATVSYGISTRVFAYSGKADGEVGLRILPSVGIEYAANNVFTPYASVNTDSKWVHNGRGVATLGPKAGTVSDPASNADVLNTDFGSKIAINKNISLDAYLETETDLHGGGRYDLFNDQTNSYNLDLTVSM